MDKRSTAGIILAAGMSTSLQCGLKQILDEFQSIMVLMGDQPLLRHEIINLIVVGFRSSGKGSALPCIMGKDAFRSVLRRDFITIFLP
jgi:CTP:molybdopterin cytidylyltransferase MocA